ncbi:TrmB family transcriptional regulator [Bacillus songklensis]|uniref:TrmB family transcriptional regulator n=1 Tax=Bacillus songklensis TaxID=1069116 RepID=A0ABV8B5B9_9BACI
MLQKFGFSQYESNVYEILVSSDEPMDATNIVKYSHVPKAKIYEVLSRMIEKGMVMDTISEKKKLYSALPLEVAIKKLTQEFQTNIDELRSNKQKRTFTDDRVWNLKSNSSILVQCKKLIEEAQHSILISAWHDDFSEYLSMLEEKERNGVAVEGLVIGEIPSQLSNLHILIPSEKHHLLERSRLIVADQKEIIFAVVENNQWQAMKTMSQPFVKFFTDFFYHDLALAKVTEKFYDQLMNDEEMRALLMKLRY